MQAPLNVQQKIDSEKELKSSTTISVSAKQMQPEAQEIDAGAAAAILAPRCSYAIQREKTWLDGLTYFEYVHEPQRFKAMKLLPAEVIETRQKEHLENLRKGGAKKGGYASIRQQNENYYANIRKDLKLKKCVLHRPKHGWGRLVGDDCMTFRSMERKSRNTILADNHIDLDIENCQAMIILCCAVDEGDKYKALQQFCDNRKAILAEGMEKYGKTREVVKKVWTALLNGGKIPDWYLGEPLAHKVRKEVLAIRTKIKQANPELYESMRQKLSKDPAKMTEFTGDEDGLVQATLRSMMSTWFQHYEVKIVAKVLEWCKKEGLLTKAGDAYKDKPIFGYIYDGFVLLLENVLKWCKDHKCEIDELLTEFAQITLNETGFDLVWTHKEFDDKFDIQEQMISVMAAPVLCESKKLTGDMNFAAMAEEFEKTNCFIADCQTYLEVKNGKIIPRKQAVMRERFGNLFCGYDEKGKKINFIDSWMKNNDEIRMYDSMNLYPNPALCPPNEFNIWIPFAMERVEEFTWRKDILDDFQYFMKYVICGHKEHHTNFPQYDYMMDWLAHMVQRPEQKPGKCPVLVSLQGSGKGTLERIIARLLGANRVFNTSTPEKSIWGDFNGEMKDAFLVILDEAEKKITTAAAGIFKNLITQGNLRINEKHVSAFIAISNHRFMVTTNNMDGGIMVQDGDRRFFVLRMSDHKKGDAAYWSKWSKVLDDFTDDSAWKTIYDWLMAREIGDFMNTETPKTEFQRNLEVSNKEPIDSWLEDMVYQWRRMPASVRNDAQHKEKKMTGMEVMSSYSTFCKQNEFDFASYKTNSNGLSSRLNNHPISQHGGEAGAGWRATEVLRGAGNNFRVFRMWEMWNYYVAKNIFSDDAFDKIDGAEPAGSDAEPSSDLPPPVAPVMVPKKHVIKLIKGQSKLKQPIKLGAQPDTDAESENE
jgi:hypothetical protein